MNSNIVNVILIKNVIKKGTLMKETTNISSDMKNLLTLGNSVSWGNGEHFIMEEVVQNGL